MSMWLAIPLGAGIVAALIAVVRHLGDKGIYAIGIIENCFAGTDHDCLQVRAYVDETLVHALPPPSKLTGRMLIRGTETSVPLTFDRVPPYVSPKPELSDVRTERLDVPTLPVIFRFDPPPHLAVYPGQLVDVYIGERSRANR
jgi:HlyD family secretion protein